MASASTSTAAAVAARLRAAVLLAGLVSSAALGTLYCILPAALLFLLPSRLVPQCAAVYRVVVDFVAAGWFVHASALLELVGGTRITLSGDGTKPVTTDERVSIIICNHHSRVDWMYLWCFCARLSICRRLKIALKAPLKNVPLFGWAMQAFQFMFLSRTDKDGDLRRLRSTLQYNMSCGPLALVIFPEGTDLSPTNASKSQEHAAEHGLAQYEHVLHPRTAGFIACVQQLGSKLDAVYDLTIAYSNNPTVEATSDPRPSEKHLLAGAHPRVVHIHSERFERAELPQSRDELRQWLTQRWEGKEARLEKMKASIQETPDAEAGILVPSSLQKVYYAALLVGTSLSLLWMLSLFSHDFWALSWLYLISSVLVWMLITKIGGLDALEIQLCQAKQHSEVALL